MDVIYTDSNRIEKGVLHDFDIDFDTTGEMDFEMTTALGNDVPAGGSWWYIEGTEYGGIIKDVAINTENSSMIFTGPNFRGKLCTKVIEPPSGHDYKIVSGNLADIVKTLLEEAELQDIYTVGKSGIVVTNYQFNRYCNLYDGIVKLLAAHGKLLSLKVVRGKVKLYFTDSVDYSNENEFTGKDLKFKVTKTYTSVNHLICLGQGDLKDRMVVHLYVDSNGNISEQKTIVGHDEITDVYENTNAATRNELTDGGIKRLEELKNQDSFDVDVSEDTGLKIGDIVGGREEKTGIYIKAEIVNAIVTINDTSINIAYKAGTDSTRSSSKNYSGGETGGGQSYIYETLSAIDNATINNICK